MRAGSTRLTARRSPSSIVVRRFVPSCVSANRARRRSTRIPNGSSSRAGWCRRAARTDAVRWRTLSEKVRATVLRLAYDSDAGLLKTDIFNPEGKVYRQANIFAVLFGLVPDDAVRRIGDKLAGTELPPVGSTWMSGLECVALMLTGHSDVVLRRIDEEWGGMVDRGYNVAFEHWWRDAKGTPTASTGVRSASRSAI